MRRTLIALATLLISTSPAFAATWQENYKAGKYAEAAEQLKSKLGTAGTEYYLADCLYRTKKTNEALLHYENAYNLEPDGQFSKFCLQVLKAHNKTPSGAASGSSAATGGDTAPSPTAKGTPARMPDVVRATKDGPTLSEVQNWQKNDQANYFSQAQQRLQKAQDNLRKATDARNQAGSAATGKDKAKLLAPFDQSIKEHSEAVSDAQQIVSLCEHAKGK